MALAAKVLVNGNHSQPRGFQGAVTSFSTLVPANGTVLRLPSTTAFADAVATSAATHDVIVVSALTESMGTVESAMQRLAARLHDDGTLLLDVENCQSLRQLRLVLEGRAGAFDPSGSIEDPSQALPLRRVLAAATAAGLHIVDVLRVPHAAPEIAGNLSQSLFAQGLVPLDWLDGVPPVRFWLQCRKVQPHAGTVLIGAGDLAAQDRTETSVRTFLPQGWDVIRCAGSSEAVAFDAAIAQSRGEFVWFLRAGATASKDLFAGLTLQALLGPVAPAQGGERACPGDVSGVLLARNDVLLAGPLHGAWANTQIGYEEWNMRLEALALRVGLVEGAFASPPPPVESPVVFASEAEAMLTRWEPLLASKRPQETAAVAASSSAVPEIAAPWAGREPRITLCMIARNEERFLGDCLRHAASAVDEIVLVDTGSVDRTIAIAESFGAKVVREEWRDDFAAPRNTALAHATGDWILVLDADEMLTPDAPARIRELVRDARAAGYHLRFTNIYTGGKTIGVMMVRLFRNLPGIAWQNVIHEQITPSLLAAAAKAGLELLTSDVAVEHLGYTDEVMQSRNKNERNERLFVKQLQQHPDDIYSLYKFGDFLRRVPGRNQDARDKLEQCLQLILQASPSLPRELPYAGEVAALCALEFTRAGQLPRAQEIVDVALRRFMPTPNLHYLAASLALAVGKSDVAIAHFRRCLAYHGQVLVVPIQDGITGHVSYAGIAQALLQKGSVERARRLLEHAIALAPAYEPAQLLLSNMHLQAGDPLAALRTLTEFLTRHPDSAGACQQITLILHRLGHRSQARRMGERAVALLRASAADHEAARMEEILAAI